MTFVSLFAGIGGFDLGLESWTHECIGQCEIDPHARKVLDRYWWEVPKHDDVTTLKHDTFDHPELVTFGSPCQDLSVAGKRAGFEGERSSLFLEAVRYIREIQEATNGRLPKLALWENVPGAFSSNDGRDFATVLSLLVGGEVRRPTDGWTTAGVAFGPEGSAEWRVLDSQHFGVPQRRRRIFLVYRPGGERAGEVLLESEGVQGDSSQGGEAGQGITGPLTSRAGALRTDEAASGQLIPTSFNWQASIAQGLVQDVDRSGPLDASQTKAIAFDTAQITSKLNRTRVEPDLPASTLAAGSNMHVAFDTYNQAASNVTHSLRTPLGTLGDAIPAVSSYRSVRRLTPKECERLQGFPDDHTRYDPNGAEIADTHRYRMLGNAVTVNVIEWIARRLQ